MEIDEDKVDDMVLALLYLTTFEDKPRLRGLEGPQLGRPRSFASQRIYLQSSNEDKIRLADRRRCEALARTV
jgi:hypothetical protein